MTGPHQLGNAASATSEFPVPADSQAAVARLNVPGEVYAVRPARGSGQAVVCPRDFENADVISNPVTPTWSNPQLVVEAYGLDFVRENAASILREVFGNDAELIPIVEQNAETQGPELIFQLNVPRSLRDRRVTYLDRYVREVDLPPNSPVPILLWAYRDAIPA